MRSMKDIIESYVDVSRPIIYIEDCDFSEMDHIIKSVSKGILEDVTFVEFNNALGMIDFESKCPRVEDYDLIHFLKEVMDYGYENHTFVILKDIHDLLNDPKVISLLKIMADKITNREDYGCTIFIISSKRVIPIEIANYITVMEIPLPSSLDIVNIMDDFATEYKITIPAQVKEELLLSLKGLSKFHILQILKLAYQDEGCIDKEDKKLILAEKAQFIKKSNLLEMINFKEDIDDIGGLENLKKWLYYKNEIFSNLGQAIKFGVDVPKGIMIIGMPGCGKSLTAKATAALFHMPLLRLDVGRLLGKYVGDSEENMRKALALSEAVSPCVLWIDELEKAFAGAGSENGGEVTTRLFGQFLTWMQEKENSVFIVGTANDISKIPPEFLRKGRFDELFFVDLPNESERKQILEIHLKKRNKWNNNIKIDELVKKTQGYNGADLESVVKETIEYAFVKNIKGITTNNLLKTIANTKPISVTLKHKIAQINATISKIDIKNASK